MANPTYDTAGPRYGRQVGLRAFGAEGQARLAQASVLIVGCGGLGTPAATYLAAAGVGRVGLFDADRVEASNLHRQVAYTPADLGRGKARVLAERLRAQNPDVTVEAYPRRFTVEDRGVLADYDLLVDASDNFATRYLCSDLAVLLGKPLVYGAAQGFEGQVSVLNHDGGPTYRCLFPEDAANAAIPDCATGGVLGPVPGLVGTYQAIEATKVLAGVGTPLAGRLLLVDALGATQMTLAVAAAPENTTVTEAMALARHAEPAEVDAAALARWLAAGGYALDVRTDAERAERPLTGTRHVPLGELDGWLASGGLEATGAEVYFVCASGVRSREGARRFNRHTGSRRGVTVAGGERAYAALATPASPDGHER